MKKIVAFVVLMLIIAFGVSFLAQEEGSLSDAANKMLEEPGAAMSDTADTIGTAAGQAAEAVDSAVEETADAVERATDDMVDAMEETIGSETADNQS